MKTNHKLIIAPAIVLSAFTILKMMIVPAYAGPIVPPGHYCLLHDSGGSDCSFTSYTQCLATASGIDAQCYGRTARDDNDSQTQWRGSYARVRSR